MRQHEGDEELDEADRALLRELLDYQLNRSALPKRAQFRVEHAHERSRLDRLQRDGLLDDDDWNSLYRLTLAGLRACDSNKARATYERCRELLEEIQKAYRESPGSGWELGQLGQRMRRSPEELGRLGTFLINFGVEAQLNGSTGFAVSLHPYEAILDAELPEWVDEPEAEAEASEEAARPQLEEIAIDGYRIFADFTASLGRLTVIVGPNGAGKSSLLDLLRFLSFAVQSPLTTEIDPHSAGKRLFHAGGPEAIEIAAVAVFLDFSAGKGSVSDPKERARKRAEWKLPPNELALRRALDPTLVTISRFQRFVASWKFYGGFDVSGKAEIRRPVFIEENPTLGEDGGNLSAVLFALMTESPEAFQELETHLRACIQGFASLNVKSRGGKGMVLATWREDGVKDDLTLADMSDGSLRILCWLTLALSPNLPPLVCIDEPEVGLHPRALSTLAGLLKVASARAQILMSTQSPYLLSQFAPDEIAVMRKSAGRVSFVRGADIKVLAGKPAAGIGEELARMFISEELEVLP